MDNRIFPDRIERELEGFGFLPGYEARGLFFVELEKLVGTDALETLIQRVCDETSGRRINTRDRRLEDLKCQVERANRERRVQQRRMHEQLGEKTSQRVDKRV